MLGGDERGCGRPRLRAACPASRVLVATRSLTSFQATFGARLSQQSRGCRRLLMVPPAAQREFIDLSTRRARVMAGSGEARMSLISVTRLTSGWLTCSSAVPQYLPAPGPRDHGHRDVVRHVPSADDRQARVRAEPGIGLAHLVRYRRGRGDTHGSPYRPERSATGRPSHRPAAPLAARESPISSSTRSRRALMAPAETAGTGR